MIELLGSKLIALSVIFTLTLICGLLPIKLFKSALRSQGEVAAKYLTVISMLSCFGAGIFLGTCFLDLLPDVRFDIMMALCKLHINISFPLSEFIMAAGLFVVLTLEQLVSIVRGGGGHGHSHGPPISTPHDSAQPTNGVARKSVTFYGGDEDSAPLLGDGGPETQDPDTITYRQLERNKSENHLHSATSDDHPVKAFFLLFAMVVHSLFEGLAVGLEKSSSQLWQLVSALLIHKSVIAFCITLNLLQSQVSMRTSLKSAILFAVMSPIGIAVGLLIEDQISGTAIQLTTGVIQGLACGTFLYVVFIEILPHELITNPSSHMLKVFMVLVGFSIITGVVFLSESEGRTATSCGSNSTKPTG